MPTLATVHDTATDLALSTLLALRHRGTVPGNRQPPGSGPLAGQFRSPRHGQGIDFDDLRAYVPGDEPRLIDWKVTARTGELHTRLYREEKEHVVSVAIDLGTAMFTGSKRLRAVVAGETAARQLWQLADTGCRCGVVIAAPDTLQVSAAATGERGALAGCAVLSNTFAEVRRHALHASHSTACLPALLDWLARGSRRLGRVVLVTGFDGVADGSDADVGIDGLRQRLGSIRTARELEIVAIADPLEYAVLPAGHYRFRDTTGLLCEANLDHDGIAALRERLAARREALRRCCEDAGVALHCAHVPDEPLQGVS